MLTEAGGGGGEGGGGEAGRSGCSGGGEGGEGGDGGEGGGGSVAVVLAAGAGSRFVTPDGSHKLLADWHGRPLIAWAVEAAVDAGIGPVWVVTGAADVRALLPSGVRPVPNPRWREGQATSLALAVDLADAAGCDRIIVGLGDQPLVEAGAWRAVAAAPGAIAVATYGGRRANPVGLVRAVWPGLARTGDAGARTLMRSCPDLVEEVACSGNPVDVDTVEDLLWS